MQKCVGDIFDAVVVQKLSAMLMILSVLFSVMMTPTSGFFARFYFINAVFSCGSKNAILIP